LANGGEKTLSSRTGGKPFEGKGRAVERRPELDAGRFTAKLIVEEGSGTKGQFVR